MQSNLLITICTLSLVAGSWCAQAQDIDAIGKQKALHINGSIGANYMATMTNDTGRAPLPSSYSLNAAVNFDLYGFSVPLTVVLNNGRFNVANSFHQFGISPHYKWLTLHAGYRQMSFSNFTLNNQTFLGAGIEAYPGRLRLSAMIGRFARAVAFDTTTTGKVIPGAYPLDAEFRNGYNYYSRQASYARFGYAVKLGYGTADNYFDLMLFKAYDKTNSLTDTFSTNRVLPEANVVLGFSTFQRVSRHFNFSLNAATSIYTYNVSAEDSIPLQFDKTVKGFIETFIKLRSTTQFQVAGDANLGCIFPNFSMEAHYQVIQPYYRSMGMTSFQSDLQSLTLSPTFHFLNHKIQFSNIFQTQHDNLNGYKLYTTSRNLLNSTLSFNPNNFFGIDLMYSGFDLSQKKMQLHASDSTRLAQQSQSLTVMPRLMFLRKSASDIISIASAYTTITNVVRPSDREQTTNFYTTVTNVISLVPSGWNFTAGLNYNNAKSSDIKLLSTGFVAGISRTFFTNHLSIGNNTILLFNRSNGTPIGKTFSTDVQVGFEPGGRHHFTIGGNYTTSPANGIYNQTDFTLYRLEAGYQYRF